jgi:hypothetical protein
MILMSHVTPPSSSLSTPAACYSSATDEFTAARFVRRVSRMQLTAPGYVLANVG